MRARTRYLIRVPMAVPAWALWVVGTAACLTQPGLLDVGSEGSGTTVSEVSTESGDGSDEATPPKPPTSLTLTPMTTKQFVFNWQPAGGADDYQLLEQVSANDEVVAVGAKTTQLQAVLTVPLHFRAGALYRVRACNIHGCSESSSVEALAPLVSAIGYLKMDVPVSLGLFGEELALSRDGNVLFVVGDDVWEYLRDPEQGWLRGALFDYEQDIEDPWDGVDAVATDSTGTHVAIADAGIATIHVREGDAWSVEGEFFIEYPLEWASLRLSGDGHTLVATSGFIATNLVQVYGFDDTDTWSLSAEFETLDMIGNGRYISTISGDGETLAICDIGQIDVYVRGPKNEWIFQAALAPGDFSSSDTFGRSVALNYDGSVLVVGDDEEDSSATGVNGDWSDDGALQAGAAWVFARDTSDKWTLNAYLKASNASSVDWFGWRVAIDDSGDIIVVSAFREGTGNIGVTEPTANVVESSGAVYVFTHHKDAGWAQRAYLKAPNGEINDRFGWDVDISGNGEVVVVGAPYEGSAAEPADNSLDYAGAVYSF